MQPPGYTASRLDSVFIALADPTRRAIIKRLGRGEASVNELAAPFDISQPAISKHLKILERAGLVERSVAGARRPARLRPQPLAEAARWLDDYRGMWDAKFDQLDGLLNEMTRKRTRRRT